MPKRRPCVCWGCAPRSVFDPPRLTSVEQPRIPPAVVADIHRSVQRAIGSEPVRATLARLSFEPFPGTPAEFQERVRSDHARWAPVVRDAGFRIEE